MKMLLALGGDAAEKVKEAMVAWASMENLSVDIDTVATISELEARTDSVRYDAIITQFKFNIKPFLAAELVAIREKNDSAALIVVLPDNSKGDQYLLDLFNGDVRNCLYSSEASAPRIMELILHQRSRADARLYYGLSDKITSEPLAQQKDDEEEITRFAGFIVKGFPDTPEATLEERLDRVAQSTTKQELRAVLMALDDTTKAQVKKISRYAGFFMQTKPQVRIVDAVEKKPESTVTSALRSIGDRLNAKKEADAEKAEQRAAEKAEEEKRRAAERERDAQLKKEENERKAAEKAEADRIKAEQKAREEEERAAQKLEDDKRRAEQKARADAEKAEADRIKAEQKAEEERIKAEQKAEEERLKNEARIKAEAEAAEAKKIAETEKEAARARAEAEKAEAEKAKAEAEKAKAEAEKAKAEERARENARKEEERRHQRELERINAEAEKERKADERKLKLVESQQEVIVEKRLVRSRVIGVVGLYRSAGASSAAVSLAKTISAHDAVTLIEVPRDGIGSIYNKYELNRKIGPNFKSVPHIIADGGTDLSGVDNVYENINFFVADPQNERLEYDSQLVASMIFGTANHVVLDLGTGIAEAKRKGYLNFVTDLILVYEADQEESYLETVRDELNAVAMTDIEPYIIRVAEKGSAKSRIEGAPILNVRKLYSAGKIVPLAINSVEEKELLSHLNISEKKRKGMFGKAKKVIVRQGTEDIAIIGTEHGVGVTHTAFMIADSLRSSYKVALVELNTSEQMASLAKELGRGKMLPVKLDGIDMYHGITYTEFADRYRAKYDFVIVDFGTIKDCAKRREALSLCGKKYLVFDAAPWKLGTLDNIMYQYMSDFDSDGQMVLLAPGADTELIRNYNMRVRGGKREIHSVPLVKVPLKMNDEIVSYMRKMILE